MNKKFNIVVIGAGYWGINIIKTLKQIGINKIFFYDKNLITQNKIKKNYNIKLINNLDEIIYNNEFKNIILSTPVESNFKILKKLIQQRKNIFVEKPVTKNFKEIINLKKILKNNKEIFMCGYIYLYNNLINYIKKIINSGKLGKIKYIEMIRKNYGPYRHHISSLKDLGSHDLSICKFFFNKKIETINNISTSITKKKSKDMNICFFNMGSIKIVIQSSWANPTKERTMLIVGSKKMLTYDELNISSPIKIYSSKYSLQNLPDKKNIFKPRTQLKINYIKPKIKYVGPLFIELKHFINCIEKKERPKTDFNFAYDLMQDLDKIEN